ncbi:dihydrodipicolinate synthase family protein [Histidinibacterium lentulum]|uniref:Dihydrodipicolinate synthase family protein n=1 Tax=Histidinibacterium lentulum TaxID=2480588 RepID=A0A3N2R7M3_9RHOB|nr:dihydrodipicolinate synthase family protein [Histidinibacterium lentulum]ROU03403.1 dihydrodipicolinate synthase family protein [Histidinibacterium lentulum]
MVAAPATRVQGVHCVLYAFFDARGQLDRGAMRAQVEAVLACGVDGITVLGLATEGPKLSVEEARDVVDWAAEDIADRCPLSVTIMGDTVADQRAALHHAIDRGAAFAVLQPPRAGAADLLDFFARVGEGIDLPLGIQNAPQYLGRSLSAEDVAWLRGRLVRLELMKAESSAVDMAALIERCGPDIACLGGRGGLEMTDCLRVGASGFVLAPDAVDHACRVHDLWLAGETEAAEAAHAEVLPALVFMMQSVDHLICYGKRIFGQRAGLAVRDRQPAQTPTDAGLRLAMRWAERLGPLRQRGS